MAEIVVRRNNDVWEWYVDPPGAGVIAITTEVFRQMANELGWVETEKTKNVINITAHDHGRVKTEEALR